FDIIIESATNAIVVDDNATAIIINDDINLTSGLVAEYRFDECEWTGAAGEVTDSGPNGLHATAMGGAELTAGVLNNAGKFDGNAYIDIPQNSELSLTGDMSMSFWVNPTDQTYSTQNANENWKQNFIVKGLGAEFRVDFWYDETDQCLCVMYTHGNDSNMVNPDNDKIYWNQWYHFVLVRDTTAKMVHFYINGVLIDSKPYDSLGIGEPTSQLSGVTLSSGTSASKFKGEIDEVKFFNGAMSGGQATEIYNNERNGLNYDGTPRNPIVCQEPFTCNETLYISNGSLDGTGAADSTKTWLHSINRGNTPYDFDAIGSGYSANSKGYNAIGYRVADNYIYALQENRLLKIDKNEIVKELGTVVGLPAKQFYAGEFGRDGYYYVGMEATGMSNTIYKIDIDQVKVVGTITLSSSVRFEDMAEGGGGYFYAMLQNADGTNNQVAKIDLTTGNVTPVGTATHNDKPAIALVYTDIDGDIFMVADQDSFYKVDTATGALYEMSSIQSLSDYHDGTSCPDANITEPVALTHITNMEKFEGNSGTTTFNFTLQFSRPTEANSGFWVTYTDGVNAVYPIGTAGHVDTHTGDEADFDGTAQYIALPIGITSYEINATVIGDTYVEHHEEFYVDIYAPNNLILMDTRAVGIILNDDHMTFRVERDDSGGYTATNAYEYQVKSHLYTQMVGKDFDYSVASYDNPFSDYQELEVEDVTIKVDLYDVNTTNPDPLLMETRYIYFPQGSPTSRIPVTLADDLAVDHATRKALFRISWLEDGNGSILYGDYSNPVDYDNKLSSAATCGCVGEESMNASDLFAIRPLGFNVAISDNLTEVTNNNTTGGKGVNPVSLAAEYPYRLNAAAVRDTSGTLETEYKTDNPWELQGVLDFDGSTTNCNILENVDLVEENTMRGTFSSGELIGDDFNHLEAGRYLFTLLDINWTHIDQNDTNPELSGCIVDYNNSERIGGKYGCNISSDIENNALFDSIVIEFEPYEFNITNTFVRNANGTNRNHVYMGDLNLSLDMGVEIGGDVIAQGKNHKRLYNFVEGCAAEAVNIDLQYLITSDQNLTDSTVYNKILTRNGTPMDFNYVYAFNGNAYNASDLYERLDNNITIPSSAFVKSQEGNSSVSILYNITKDLNEPMNPVKVIFRDLNASSVDATSYSNGSDNFIPYGGADTGQLDRNGTGTRFFYYSKVAPYQENYGDVTGTSLNTPIYVAIYCGDMNQSWCSTMINTNGLSESFAQSGWYTAHLHDSSTDGSISQLSVGDPSDSVTDAASLPNFHDGRAGRIEDITTATNHGSLPWRVTVTIDQMSPWLYHHIINDEGKPFWRVNFKGNSNGVITGVGETGHITEIDANTNYSNSKGGKIDW
ncbi:MAG: LamG domain-containing protein, partial [Campylobacterales bacterium]|nr:LamG domain-containing protein [Campylobacterales bacterium]